MLNLEVKSMLKHGNLDLEKLIKSQNGQFWIRNLDLPCVTNCHTWFGRGKRQLWVVTWGKSLMNPALCRLYWNWCWWLDEMRWCDDLCRDGLMIVFCHMHWWDDVVDLFCFVSCLVLGICLLPSDWWFFGGLTLSHLRTTQVLSSRQHSQQLLGPHIKSLTHLLGRPLVEIFLWHL